MFWKKTVTEPKYREYRTLSVLISNVFDEKAYAKYLSFFGIKLFCRKFEDQSSLITFFNISLTETEGWGGAYFKRKHLVVNLKQKDGKLLVIFNNTILTLSSNSL